MSAAAAAGRAGFDPERDPDPVPSPCVGVCALDAARAACIGCGRTLDEIAAWRGLDEAGRRMIWRRLRAARREAAP